MSFGCCTCGFGCNEGCGCRVIVLPDNPATAYSAANINTLGIGVYDSQDGNEFDFRGVYSANSSLIITLDAGNNAIKFELDVSSIIDDLPQATTTQRGVGETATDAEALAKASTTVFLTPSNLAAMGSTTTFAGLTAYATNAQTQAGLSSTLAVTPAGLASLTALQKFTVTWADAVARAADAPEFAGQFGVQLDSDIPWISTGVAAGDFNKPLLVLGNSLNVAPAAQTLLDLNSQDWIISGGTFQFEDGDFNVGTVSAVNANFGAASTVTFSNVVDFDGTVLKVLGVGGNQQILATDGAGEAQFQPISNFLTTNFQSTGWTNFTNSAVRKTGNCNTITLPELAQVVDTLIQTLGTAHLLPVP